MVGSLPDLDEVLHVDNVEESTFRDAMSLFATGVTVITSRTDDGPVGMTASAVTSLSLHPVLLLVCISTRLPTHEVLESTGRFAVNVLGESDSALALRFATPGIEKFSGIRHTDRGVFRCCTARSPISCVTCMSAFRAGTTRSSSAR